MGYPSVAGLSCAQLSGALGTDGYRIRAFQGRVQGETRLGGVLAGGTLCLVINFAGQQHLGSAGVLRPCAGGQLLAFLHEPGLEWRLASMVPHRFLLVEYSAGMLERLHAAGLREAGVQGRQRMPFVLGPAPVAVLTLGQQLLRPPAHATCLPVWFHAKVMELASLSLHGSEGEEAAAAQEGPSVPGRVAQAAYLLERDLENPPTLEMLADEVGLGPFQLSRQFRKEQGCSIPEFLRGRRMEQAARLLRTTRQSISEVAVAVGYESFSAFSRAFIREHGVTPSAFRDGATAAQPGARRGKQPGQTG